MQKEITNADIVRRVLKLAFGKPNDIVRLFFIEPGDIELIDRLSLGLISEMKRSDKGIEVKLINRVELLKFAAGILAESGESGAEGFFAAIDKAAEKLGEDGREV